VERIKEEERLQKDLGSEERKKKEGRQKAQGDAERMKEKRRGAPEDQRS